ncbi:MAG: hypothetical protein JXR77_02100 [Lentisphaeria bacterium]|nr:hypothetical protein [Lentisphaeria bacterium]
MTPGRHPPPLRTLRAGLLAVACWAASHGSPAPAAGARIRPLGCIGNSGEAGEGLVLAVDMPLRDCASGVAAAADGSLWVSGGTVVNRLGLDGHRMETRLIEPAGTVVDSRTFAVLDETLFFLGRPPSGEVLLFALPLRADGIARPCGVSLPRRRQRHLPYELCPQPVEGRLVLAAELADREGTSVLRIDPASASVETWFSLPGEHPGGTAADPHAGTLYLGYRPHGEDFRIAALAPVPAPVQILWSAPCPKTPAIPTQFHGRISLAEGALWDSAWYGFLARLDRQGRGNPGRVLQWHHELEYPTQVSGLPGREPGTPDHAPAPLLLATPMPDALYWAEWDPRSAELRLLRRYGCLPVVSSLGLTSDGWITAGTARTQVWWRWEDPPWAAPAKTDIHIAVTPGYFRGEEMLAFAAQYHLANDRDLPRLPAVFTSRPGDRNEARRCGRNSAIREPAGLTVRTAAESNGATLLVTDTATAGIWRTSLWLPTLEPSEKGWEQLPLEGCRLQRPTDLVAFTDGSLMVADSGRIVLLQERAQGYALAEEWSRWGDAPAEQFGENLRLCVDADRLLVADTDRHRLLWFAWPSRRLEAQFGETDQPDTDPQHLDHPTFVCLRGSRAVVADTGNQRILKLQLEAAGNPRH